MTKPVLAALVPAILAPAALLGATPAAAQGWGHAPSHAAGAIRSQVYALRADIDRATARGTISRREAEALRRQAWSLQRQYDIYARGGIDRNEARLLERRVADVRSRLRRERRDRDGHRG